MIVIETTSEDWAPRTALPRRVGAAAEPPSGAPACASPPPWVVDDALALGMPAGCDDDDGPHASADAGGAQDEDDDEVPAGPVLTPAAVRLNCSKSC
mmetsp:Transcript_96047/g.275821  ORF Transcript_96047/g.275821 Transcript_96047/m.275821 type:complete len:97 (+) Transcript_96047:1062-1352(+)